jgi:hypothetical protein
LCPWLKHLALRSGSKAGKTTSSAGRGSGGNAF